MMEEKGNTLKEDRGETGSDHDALTLIFLGTGTSNGVPVLGCHCAVCDSLDAHDNRLRAAALVEHGDTRILIDCGPDIRQQLMPMPFKPLTGVLLTHTHYDHIGGIDDLRPYCAFGDISIFADEATTTNLQRVMPYCFTKELYPGVPRLQLHTVEPHKAFRIGSIEVLPLRVMHGKLPILGYRFGKLAYITDMKSMAPEDVRLLHGVDILVVNALRFDKPHHSHMLVDEAIAFAREVGACHTYFTHVTHEIGRHAEANSRLPQGFTFAYDGQRVVCPFVDRAR